MVHRGRRRAGEAMLLGRGCMYKGEGIGGKRREERSSHVDVDADMFTSSRSGRGDQFRKLSRGM